MQLNPIYWITCRTFPLFTGIRTCCLCDSSVHKHVSFLQCIIKELKLTCVLILMLDTCSVDDVLKTVLLFTQCYFISFVCCITRDYTSPSVTIFPQKLYYKASLPWHHLKFCPLTQLRLWQPSYDSITIASVVQKSFTLLSHEVWVTVV
jgi:hypothetical protein